MKHTLPELGPIKLYHRVEFEELLRKYPPLISEHTFTNLFMWRDFHKERWARLDDWIVIEAMDKAGLPYFFAPIGGGAGNILSKCIEHLEKEGAADPRIERVPVPRGAGLVTNPAIGGTAEPDRNQFDYVYSSLDLIRLSGRKFHTQKNHLNKFRKTYSWSYERIGPDAVEECLDLEGEWCHMKKCRENPGLAGEERAIMDVLQNMEALGTTGGIIRIDGKIEAFTLGERLNQDTAVIHIEKANPEIDGLYVAINQSFVENELAGYEFVNREQDLGIPGLRAAKESYNPVKMIEKFIVRRKKA